MAHNGKDQYKNDLTSLTVLAGAALALFGAMLLAVIAYAGWSANQTAFEREATLIENSLNQAMERALSEQKSVAWWDTAVLKITDQSIDTSFVDNEFGVFLTETYEQDEIYILNTHDQPVYAFAGSKRVAPSLFERHRAVMAPIIAEIRRQMAPGFRVRPDLFGAEQGNYHLLAGVMRSARWAGHIISLDGRPAIVTAITIVPNVNLQLLTGTPMILVGVTYIDDAFISEIGRSLLLKNLRLRADAPHAQGLVTERFVTDDGVRLGVLSWNAKYPGEILLRIILPLVALALAGAGAVFGQMLLGLKRTSAELAQSELQARHEALHDALSGLPNRSHFLDRLARLLADPRKNLKRVVAAHIDVDRFKDINDTMGHHAGDILIKTIAARLRSQARQDDFLARFGGDEFAILCVTSPHGGAEALARRVAQAFAAPFVIEGQNIRVTASIGIAAAPEDGRTADELMRHADIALYEAKRQGRDRAVLFAASMGEKVAQRRIIELDLRAAIDADELNLHFQPIISAMTGKIVGAEALLRWTHPKYGPIPPASFIPAAEESGLMPALGDWVLRRALDAARRWPNLQVAVNLSPVQFRHTDLPSQLRRLTSEYGINPRNIVLEITEGVLLESDQRTKETLESIHAMGFKLALDDFGTGYSSLAYLCEFKFDKIKIDRSFVAGFARGDVPRSVLSAISALGHGLGMDIVAEGIESEFDALAMRHLGCTEMQGHYFSKAVDEASFEALLARDLVTLAQSWRTA